jgi:hypothetical protein
MYSTSSSSKSSDTDTKSFATIELESRDEVNPVAKEESRGDEEVFEAFETIRAESASAEVMDPPPGSSSVISSPTAWVTLRKGNDHKSCGNYEEIRIKLGDLKEKKTAAPPSEAPTESVSCATHARAAPMRNARYKQTTK